ncbi:ethanolamine ammonia-lyase reactivating factor EutA [Natronococcus jeotgali]|uniref:Reactivating factor for ethanolamine ammonia lyase n=1 Tax=Natronococcus jeotgali DSM 18795 TaxID=1227498 RepID=L9XU80_9EURY|nr:ethanolamine ammonia-lyase reactivating factor EutA [Natronococcus jeotgali]ELY64168.1 reactivating factor for ethanolamine ammonia lyase [Natronococcus jeotgali DSM 18795]
MTDRSERLTSVGIDVGTTTTHTVVSRLRVETPPGGVASPEIADREIAFRGPVRETPLLDPETIDVEAVAAHVATDLEAAGVDPAAVDTGAVIVTGETARRENAEPLVHRIAADAGRFVAATAGAELEAVLAGRGSGAATRAAERGETVANVDVGGGTTNAAIFEGRSGDGRGRGGELVGETRCLDVGGRLVRFDGHGRVESISPPAWLLADALELPLEVGDEPDDELLAALAAAMADRVVDLLEGPPFDALTRELAIGELPSEPVSLDGVVFSGGVGRLVGSPPSEPFAYGDLGGPLAAALRDHERVRAWSVREPHEDLRATVVGAGTESTTLSGRTISIEPDLFPIRNVPVADAGDLAGREERALREPLESAVARLRELHDLADLDAVALAIADVGPLEYDRLGVLADALTGAVDPLPPSLPVVVVTRQNCAKALGQLLRRRTDRPLAVLDELRPRGGDYLDVGAPIAGHRSVPVVVKTLAF